MLPTPHEPLWLRLEEQNLHIPAAEFLPLQRPPASPLCSPLPANPYASVPGSKIFTLPPPVFTLPRGRRPPLFAPHSPRALVTPFRGAKSSHSHRRISPSQATGSFLSLLPAPREPLWLRLGEQNLHIPAAGFRPLRRPAASSLCSPLPASPCGSVSGSKIFTFPPPDFALSGDRRPPSLLPTPHEPLWLRFGEQNLHIPAGAFRLPQQPASHSNRKRVARASSGLPDAARPLISQFFISNVRKSNRHESAHMLFRPDSLPQCNPLYP